MSGVSPEPEASNGGRNVEEFQLNSINIAEEQLKKIRSYCMCLYTFSIALHT